MKFRVQLTTDEDGWIVAEAPELPGCISQGSTRDEAIANIKDAIEGWLHVRLMRLEGGSEAVADSDAEAVEVEV